AGPSIRLIRAAPQITSSPSSRMPPARPVTRPARAFLIARQAMTSNVQRTRGRALWGAPAPSGGVFRSHHRLSAPLTEPAATGTVDHMIEIHELTKRYGATTAVSDLTFTVQYGTVTGFLGPNSAGQYPTLLLILGLGEPTSGSVTVNGRSPRGQAAPLHEVGGMLD